MATMVWHHSAFGDILLKIEMVYIIITIINTLECKSAMVLLMEYILTSIHSITQKHHLSFSDLCFSSMVSISITIPITHCYTYTKVTEKLNNNKKL